MEAFKKAELVKRHEDDVVPEPMPDMLVTSAGAFLTDMSAWHSGGAQDWHQDKFGALRSGTDLLGLGRFLYRLHDVTVIRGGPLGPWGWHILMEPNICAVEACPRGNRDLAGVEGITFEFDAQKIGVNVMPAPEDVYHETEPSVFYGSEFDNNYYHRVFDLLPRAWAETEGLIPPGTRWHHNDKQAVRYDTLWFPSWWPALGYAPGPIEWLRNQPRAAASDGPDILYLTRDGTKKRRVVNETDVLRACERASVLTMSGRTLQEQQAIVRRAKVIIAPHGAALSNIVWAERCSVVEFVPERYQHPCFQYIAKFSGHWYGRMICPSDHAMDMTVDIEAFRAMLEEARRAVA